MVIWRNFIYIYIILYNHYWLVVYLPLWKMMEWKSVGMTFHSIYEMEQESKSSSHHQPVIILHLDAFGSGSKTRNMFGDGHPSQNFMWTTSDSMGATAHPHLSRGISYSINGHFRDLKCSYLPYTRPKFQGLVFPAKSSRKYGTLPATSILPSGKLT